MPVVKKENTVSKSKTNSTPIPIAEATPPPLAPSCGVSVLTQSEDVEKVSKALVGFAAEAENIGKDSEGHNYNYASLETVIDSTQALRKKHKLAIFQLPISHGSDQVGVYTRVVHESGQYLAATYYLPLPEMRGINVTQAAGAAITYARRYAYLAALGLAPVDTDAVYE